MFCLGVSGGPEAGPGGEEFVEILDGSGEAVRKFGVGRPGKAGVGLGAAEALGSLTITPAARRDGRG